MPGSTDTNSDEDTILAEVILLYKKQSIGL